MATAVARDISAIKKSAESMVSAEPAVVGSASPGGVVRQGDVYLVAIDALPAGKQIKSRQLAEGTTQGSRHIAEGDCEIVDPADKTTVIKEINRLCPTSRGVLMSNRDEILIGPAFRCDGPVTVTHPEHGHRVLEKGSIWATKFQRSHAEETRRVRD